MKKELKFLQNLGSKKLFEKIKTLLEKVGVKYDIWFSEKELYKKNLVKKRLRN